MLDALQAVAARPERWEQVIDALGEPGAAPVARSAAPDPDPPGVGVVTVSGSGGVCAWNPAGEAVFLQRLGAISAAGGTYFSPVNHEALAQARRRLGSGGQVIVKFTAAADEAPVFAYVTAEADLPQALKAGLAPVAAGSGRIAIVFPAVDASDRLWAHLRQSFGLTPAETRLAAKLKEGLSLKDAAAALGVSVNTVRNQLRGVFDKVGLARQSDLVRALTELGGLAGLMTDVPVEPIAATEDGAVRTAPPLQSLDLGDRRLAWRDYGDPRGRPVLMVHQGLGCSVLPRGSDSLARDLGLRLICPERPGAGRSDPHPAFSFEAVGADMAALCRSLGAKDLRVVGVMSGAPFALCAAAALGEGVARVMLVSARPSGQMAETEADRAHRMVLFRRRLLRNSWLADLMFALLRRRLNPRQIERFVRTAASAPSDAAYLADHPGVVGYVCEYIAESLALTSRGIADEVKCAARNPALDLAGLKAPVTVWHGADDPMAGADDVVAWLGGRVAETRVFPGVGHFMPLRQWPEILGWLAD